MSSGSKLDKILYMVKFVVWWLLCIRLKEAEYYLICLSCKRVTKEVGYPINDDCECLLCNNQRYIVHRHYYPFARKG